LLLHTSRWVLSIWMLKMVENWWFWFFEEWRKMKKWSFVLVLDVPFFQWLFSWPRHWKQGPIYRE
jgi:hypothetical protein